MFKIEVGWDELRTTTEFENQGNVSNMKMCDAASLKLHMQYHEAVVTLFKITIKSRSTNSFTLQSQSLNLNPPYWARYISFIESWESLEAHQEIDFLCFRLIVVYEPMHYCLCSMK